MSIESPTARNGVAAAVSGEHKGRLAGRYRLLEELGRGGMGVVYRAHDLELDEPVAIKLLASPELSVRDVQRLRDEVRLARMVSHRNVARIHDIGDAEGIWFLTMQLVEGTTLRQALRACRVMPLVEALELVIELCEGLAAAHDAGVLHLDLKPENVMIPRGGGVVVLDFGISRRAGEAPPVEVAGTPGYMAPEQRFAGETDARTDLWAVGVILVELLAGAPVHTPEEASPVLARLGVSSSLATLVRRLLAFEREARPTSARAVADALSAELGLPAMPAWRRSGRRRLAILPFRASSQAAELATGLGDELGDRLASLQGITVLAPSASARFADASPQEAGVALGADAIVEGSVRRVGALVQLSARLVDAATGEVTWHERFEAPLRDVLELQDQMARRLAEALRVELGTHPYRGVASDEAIELYLRARGKLARQQLRGPHGALVDLEHLATIAPMFAPATALRALAATRVWFYASLAGDDVEAARLLAVTALDQAQTRAREFAETHLAAGAFAAMMGQLPTAIREIERCLELAPSQPFALEYQGRLLCEASRADAGLPRIQLAVELDPRLYVGLAVVARHHALHREWRDYDAAIEEIGQRGGLLDPAVLSIQLRVAVWRRRGDAIERWATEAVTRYPNNTMLVAVAKPHLEHSGLERIEAIDAMLAAAKAQGASSRFVAFAYQIAAEIGAAFGDTTRAFGYLEQSSAAGLLDLDWLDLCPVLAELRTLPGFPEIRRAVRTRAAALWR